MTLPVCTVYLSVSLFDLPACTDLLMASEDSDHGISRWNSLKASEDEALLDITGNN